MFNKFLHDFHNNYSSEAYNYLGSFYYNDYTIFRVYAPNADLVSVVGDFNNNVSDIIALNINPAILGSIVKWFKTYNSYSSVEVHPTGCA